MADQKEIKIAELNLKYVLEKLKDEGAMTAEYYNDRIKDLELIVNQAMKGNSHD